MLKEIWSCLRRTHDGYGYTRKATLYYTQFATDLSRELANYNFVVVSGLAAGIDAAAHRGAMKSGLTIAVLGHGIDRVYPSSHRTLYKEIETNGLLVTEFPPLHPADRWTFPLRNRIIAGLSVGVIVVESAASGGSLITADQALSYNREVFAVPGRPGDEVSAGPNLLIQRQTRSVYPGYPWWTNLANSPPNYLSGIHYALSVQELEVLNTLGLTYYIDTLQSKLSIPASAHEQSSFLLLQNLIRELSGKYFVKIINWWTYTQTWGFLNQFSLSYAERSLSLSKCD